MPFDLQIEVSDNLIHQLLTSTDEELLGIASETESTIDGPIPALDELQPGNNSSLYPF